MTQISSLQVCKKANIKEGVSSFAAISSIINEAIRDNFRPFFTKRFYTQKSA